MGNPRCALFKKAGNDDNLKFSGRLHGTVRVGPVIRSAYWKFLVFLFSGKQGSGKVLVFQ
mgnify:CR=1 FL=1